MNKKILTVIISIVMVITTVVFVPSDNNIIFNETVSADSKFTPRLTEPDWDNEYYYSKNPYYQSGYGMPNCTCYAYGRAYELLGQKPALSEGDAMDWYGYNISTGAYPYGSEPRLGAIACWCGDYYGHVAVVEKIEGDEITLSQSSWGGRYFYTWTGSDMSNIMSGFQGYIYIGGWDNIPEGHEMKESEAAGQTIPDGDYWIYSALSETYYMDIPGDDVMDENDVNVVMWINENKMPGKYDVWTVEYLDNGFYSLTQKNSDVCLASDGSDTNAANVCLWRKNTASYGQQWSISPTDIGYSLQARCSSFYLDVDEGKIEKRTNVQTFKGDGTRAQRFAFIPYSDDEQTVEDGVYNIRSAADPAYNMDVPGESEDYKVNSNVHIWKGVTDKFEITYAGDGYYTICECKSGLALDIFVNGGYLDNEQNVKLNWNEGTRNQLWKISRTEDGHYRFISKLSGYCIDIEDGALKNGQNIYQYNYSDTDTQKWDLEDPENITTTVTTTTGNTTTATKTTTKTTATTTKPSGPSNIPGDVNNNGTVNIYDLTMMRRFLLNRRPLTEPKNGDINGDGKINVFDYLILKRYIIADTAVSSK